MDRESNIFERPLDPWYWDVEDLEGIGFMEVKQSVDFWDDDCVAVKGKTGKASGIGSRNYS